VVISAAAAAALIVLAPIIAAELNSPAQVGYLRLFAVEIPIFALGSVHRSTLVGQGKFGQGAIAMTAYWLSRLALMLLLVGFGLSVAGAIVANVAAAAVHVMVCRVFVRPALLRRPETHIPLRDIARYALPLAAYTMGSLAWTKGDLLIVRASAALPGTAGFYSSAKDLAALPVSYVVGSFSSLLLATLTHLWERGQDTNAQSMGGQALRVVFWLLPFAALVAGSAPGIVTLLYGESYSPAGRLLAWLIFAAVGHAVISVGTGMFTARGRPRLLVVFILPMATLALSAYLTLTPRFGSLGTAMARTALAALGAFLVLGLLGRTCGVRPSGATVCRPGSWERCCCWAN